MWSLELFVLYDIKLQCFFVSRRMFLFSPLTLNILWFRKHRSFRLFIFDSPSFCSSIRLCTCFDSQPVGYMLNTWMRYFCFGQNQNICRLHPFWPQNINSDLFASFVSNIKDQRGRILVGSDLLLPVKSTTISVLGSK